MEEKDVKDEGKDDLCVANQSNEAEVACLGCHEASVNRDGIEQNNNDCQEVLHRCEFGEEEVVFIGVDLKTKVHKRHN